LKTVAKSFEIELHKKIYRLFMEQLNIFHILEKIIVKEYLYINFKLEYGNYI